MHPKNTVRLNLALPPLPMAALQLLAEIQAGGGRADAAPVLVPLLQAALERLLPGAWARALPMATLATSTPEARCHGVLEQLRAELGTDDPDLIARALGLIERTLRGSGQRELLRAQVLALRAELEADERRHAAADPSAPWPLTRTWYLLGLCLEHATLLRPEVRVIDHGVGIRPEHAGLPRCPKCDVRHPADWSCPHV